MTQEGVRHLREAILRTVAFFDTLEYPPTWAEVAAWGEFGSWGAGVGSWGGVSVAALAEAKESLLAESLVETGEGRVALHNRLAPLCALVRERTPLFPRKIRRAQQVAKWLARNPNVRFVALANTTALAHARDASDLDFFVIVRHGSIWSTRLIGGAPYRLRGKLAGGANEPADAVCLSYFISDANLDLAPHMLRDGTDPYFRYWFLALLPLYDDGVSTDLWNANTAITRAHPRAEPWMLSPDIAVCRPRVRLHGAHLLERPSRAFQQRWFPATIRERMNHDTSVIVSDHALKFHVDDRRAAFRAQYHERLRELGF